MDRRTSADPADGGGKALPPPISSASVLVAGAEHATGQRPITVRKANIPTAEAATLIGGTANPEIGVAMAREQAFG
jgi:hypothetical protein